MKSRRHWVPASAQGQARNPSSHDIFKKISKNMTLTADGQRKSLHHGSWPPWAGCFTSVSTSRLESPPRLTSENERYRFIAGVDCPTQIKMANRHRSDCRNGVLTSFWAIWKWLTCIILIL